jgi:hypothetical protein
MELVQFCRSLATLVDLKQTEKALALLWFHDEKDFNVIMSSGQLSKIMLESGLGNPNSTQLKESIRKSGYVLSTSKGFRLKDLSRSKIRDWIEPILGEVQPDVDQDLGFLPKDVWIDTRPYIEKVCGQMNGCFQFHFYDAASVMVRRLVETLLIECYEHLKRESEVKGADGNYLMLRDLIKKANDTGGLNLGREAKKALDAVKELGDRSAHNRRYNAVKADLEKVQSGVRVVVDEMINLSNLRTNKKPAASP